MMVFLNAWMPMPRAFQTVGVDAGALDMGQHRTGGIEETLIRKQTSLDTSTKRFLYAPYNPKTLLSALRTKPS